MLTLSDKVNVKVKVMVTLYVCEHNLSPVHLMLYVVILDVKLHFFDDIYKGKLHFFDVTIY